MYETVKHSEIQIRYSSYIFRLIFQEAQSIVESKFYHFTFIIVVAIKVVMINIMIINYL